jgi:ketosteroid isomerase-like protein
MAANKDLIERFYGAFATGDHATMEASYSDTATFSDPVFPRLDAEQARAMWRMFCTSGNEIELTYSDIDAGEQHGSAHWEAIYAFPKTGRRVHNKIDANFQFQDGKIVGHRDNFNFYAWTRMALGPTGALLGWTPIVQNQVRKQAASQLRRFMAGEARKS